MKLTGFGLTRLGSLGAFFAAAPGPAASAEGPEARPPVDPPVADRISELEDRIESLEQPADEPSAEVQPWPPVIASADGQHRFALRSRLHVDGRFDPTGDAFDPEIVIRRARFGFRAMASRRLLLDLRIELGEGGAGLRNAFVEIEATRWLRLRVGQMLVPFSLQRLVSSNVMLFPERPVIVDKLAGPRDVGVMAQVDVLDARLGLQLGVYNGNGQSGAGDIDYPFDLVGRLRAHPFSWLVFDGAYRWSPPDEDTTLPADAATDGGVLVPLATYDRENAARDGSLHRASSGARFFLGPVMLQTEGLMEHTEDVKLAGQPVGSFTDWGGFVDVAWAVTGEQQVLGELQPQRPMHAADGGWSRGVGAWQIAARYELAVTDPDTFATGVAMGTDTMHSATGSVVWTLVPGVRWLVSYTYARFSDAVGDPVADRDAHAIVSRLDFHI